MMDEQPGAAVPADSPTALMRPDDLVAALARFLRRVHGGETPDGAAVVDIPSALVRAKARIAAGDVAAEHFDDPYRAQTPERLADIVDGLAAALRDRPVEACPTLGDAALSTIRIAGGEVVAPTGAGAVGDPYADLAWLARDLSIAVGPAAVPALFDACGIERPDPVRIEAWITLHQLLRP